MTLAIFVFSMLTALGALARDGGAALVFGLFTAVWIALWLFKNV